MLQRGDRGPAVKALQEKLVGLGFMEAEDMATGPGIFGPRTENAVKAYKATRVDGVADEDTLKSLGLLNGGDEPVATVNAVVDISHHNGDPNLAQAKASGLIGVIHKATQGTEFADPKYTANREAARGAGLLWGAYHFPTGSDPVAQADFFLAQAKPDGETLLVLDFEKNPNGSSMDLASAEAFVLRIREKTGKLPGLYSGNDIKEQLGNNTNHTLAECWFWLAQYGSTPVVPPNWETWTMWQYTDGNHGPEPRVVPGIGACDRDRFQGTEAELRGFWEANGV